MGSTGFFSSGNWLFTWIKHENGASLCSYHMLMRQNVDPIWSKLSRTPPVSDHWERQAQVRQLQLVRDLLFVFQCTSARILFHLKIPRTGTSSRWYKVNNSPFNIKLAVTILWSLCLLQESARILALNVAPHTRKACVLHKETSWKRPAHKCVTSAVSNWFIIMRVENPLRLAILPDLKTN